MRSFTKTRLSGATMIFTTFALLLTPISPAHAYSPNPTAYWLNQNSETCAEAAGYYPSGWFSAGSSSGHCYINGTRYGRTYDIDPGGRNLFVELGVYGTGDIGIVSFEAYDEILHVADTRNDDDMIYVWINSDGPYYPPGSGDVYDGESFNLSLDDGKCYNIKITDDIQGSDVIANTGSGLPCLIP